MGKLVEITECVGDCLKWSSMADNASFGLEYLLHGKRDERTRNLLQEGIKLCEILQEDITAKTVINSSKLEAYSAISSLVAPSDKQSTTEKDELKNISKNAKKIKRYLQKAIDQEATYSEENIREFQRFFNKISVPYLRKAFNDMRRIETIRGASTNVRIGRSTTGRIY